MSTSLVILGCGQRKRRTSRLLPAIERYDGPTFRVVRKHSRGDATGSADVYVLSARFGLIRGDVRIPRYDRRLVHESYANLERRVVRQLGRTLKRTRLERLFISVGRDYWPLLAKSLARHVPASKVVVAAGSIGGRASQLARWLNPKRENRASTKGRGCGEATLLGTTVRLSRSELLQKARRALRSDATEARRFQTWCVLVDGKRVAPKWLVSVLFDKPVARFRTADARRVLSLLKMDCVYAACH
jgi:hypothetical protein